MADLAYNPPVDLDRLDEGAAALPVSQGLRFGVEADVGRMTRQAIHAIGGPLQGQSDPLAFVPEAGGRPDPVTPTPPISAEDANARYGVDGYLRFNQPTSEYDAAWLSAQAQDKRWHDAVLAHSSPSPLMDFGASLGGALIDPTGLAIAVGTGGLGEEALAAAGLGRAGAAAGEAVTGLGRVANAAGGVARTFAAGAIDNTPYVLASAGLNLASGDDYSLGDGLRDIAAGAILHTGLHLAGRAWGAISGRGNAFEPDPAPAAGVPEAVSDLPAASRQGAFALALDRAANDEPVDVGQHVQRELEPPAIGRLDEISATPDLDGFRPLQDDQAVTQRGTEIPVRYGLAELDSLTTSHDDDLSVNPAYPAELQPRARERAGAQARNLQLESELNPRLLLNDVGAGAGAPIVAPDGVVESGNGRTIALRRSAARGTPAYGKYLAELKAQGLPVEGMTRPVLVRMRAQVMQGAERAALAREMNADVTERMGAGEQALADAARIPDSAWDLIEEGKGPTSSRAFAREFIARAAPDQANVLAGADGALSPEGARRIRAAVLARAYGDARLVGQVFEDEATPARKLGESLADAAPAWARLRAAAARGEIPRELDLTDNLTQAVDLARHAAELGQPLAEVVAELEGQGDMFKGSALSADTLKLLRMMFGDKLAKLDPKLASRLRAYVEQALKVKPGKDLFGGEAGANTARQILKDVADRFGRGDAGEIDVVRPPGPSKGELADRGPVIDLTPVKAEAAEEPPARAVAPSDQKYFAARAERDALEAKMRATSEALQAYPRRDNGLTPDEVKFSPEYRRDKAKFDQANARLRAFNKDFVKTFAKEIAGDRALSREGKGPAGPELGRPPENGGPGTGGGTEDTIAPPAERAKPPSGEAFIAADPELKALADEVERAEAEGGAPTQIPDKEQPDTIAKAVRAAAVCLAEEGE